MKKFLTAMVLSLTTWAAPAAMAQDWPSGPVQVVIPSKPGGGMDLMGRVFANYLQEEIGSPVVVINQSGGGGTLAYEQVRTSEPNGTTLLFTSNQLMLQHQTGLYDRPVSDFTTIAIMQSYPTQVYAVAPDAPWNNLKDLVEDARNNPDKFKVGVTLGGVTHFIAGNIMMQEDVKFKLVQAASETDKIAALQGGFIDVGNLAAKSAKQYEEAGKLKVLGMINAEPDPSFPEYTTAMSQGLNVSWESPLILWGPANMPADIVDQINMATKGFGEDPTVKDQLAKMSSKFKYMSTKEAQDYVAEADVTLEKLAKDLGLAKQ